MWYAWQMSPNTLSITVIILQTSSETSTSSTKFMKIILVLSLTSIVISLASMVCVLTLAKSDHGQNQDVIPEDTGWVRWSQCNWIFHLYNSHVLATFAPKSKALRIVTRNEWLAQPPRERLDDLKLPVNKVIISHTTTEECNTQVSCIDLNWFKRPLFFVHFPVSLSLSSSIHSKSSHRCWKLWRYWLQLPNRRGWQCLRGTWLAQGGSICKRSKL